MPTVEQTLYHISCALEIIVEELKTMNKMKSEELKTQNIDPFGEEKHEQNT